MNLSFSEKKFYDCTKTSDIHAKRAIIIITLFIAAFLMVAAWILHLRFNFSFWIAFLLSMAFAFIEYLLNTAFTRYSKYYNDVFEPYQLACISLIGGLIATFIIGFTVFKNEIQWETDVIGAIFFIISTVLLLWNKKTNKKTD